MTSHLFDTGDMQRLQREEALTEQLPRQPIVEDRGPPIDPALAEARPEPPDFSTMLKAIMMLLAERNAQ